MFKEVGAGFKPAPTVLFASLVCFVVKFIFWLRLGRAGFFCEPITARKRPSDCHKESSVPLIAGSPPHRHVAVTTREIRVAWTGHGACSQIQRSGCPRPHISEYKEGLHRPDR